MGKYVTGLLHWVSRNYVHSMHVEEDGRIRADTLSLLGQKRSTFFTTKDIVRVLLPFLSSSESQRTRSLCTHGNLTTSFVCPQQVPADLGPFATFYAAGKPFFVHPELLIEDAELARMFAPLKGGK